MNGELQPMGFLFAIRHADNFPEMYMLAVGEVPRDEALSIAAVGTSFERGWIGKPQAIFLRRDGFCELWDTSPKL